MVFLHEICSNDSWRNEEPELIFLQKNNPQTLSSEHTRAATTLRGRILGRETADLDFTCKYSAGFHPPAPPQKNSSQTQNPGRSAVLANEKPRTEELLLIFYWWNYFPTIYTFASSPAWLQLLPGVVTPSACFALQISQTRIRYPHPRTKMYFSTIFKNTRVKAVTAIPTGNLNFSGIPSTVV